MCGLGVSLLHDFCFLYLIYFLFYVYECFLECMCEHKKRALDSPQPLELELQTIVSCYVGADN